MPLTNSESGENHASASQHVEDPVFLNSLREAKIIISIWALAMVYTCTYCYLYGYESHPSDPAAVGPAVSSWVGPLESFDRDPTTLTTPFGLGIPDWVFYGVVAPWIACLLATFVFCLFVFKEDELGDDEELAPAASEGGSSDD
ncbi:MAG: hypothetical protein ABGX16_22025 [Pirellulales bacterium]